ncbi:MAG: VOC family protein [Kosmotogaceae bacterium]|nr:VOC family protein [Kosmotogaceae bacterium]
MKVVNTIVFLGTENLSIASSFYKDLIGLELFKDQGKCQIFFTVGGGMIGFCDHLQVNPGEDNPIVTLLTDEVDEFYEKLTTLGVECTEPTVDEKFNIYHFFTKDPDGYRLEIQRFLEG